jgi:hypothetical protein
VRARFPVLLALVLGIALVLPVTGFPGAGPRPVPTRVQTFDLDTIALAGGRGMSGVEQSTASRSGVIETDDFGLVGLSWDAPPPEGSVVKVRVREDAGWTPWLEIPYHDDHGPDPGTSEGRAARSGTDPMLTGRSDAVQVWVQTPDGQAPEGTEVHLVDTDQVDIQQPELSQAAAAVGMPPVITRAQWGADESKRNRDPIYSSVVKVGFVHHTVTSSTYTRAQAAGQVRNLYAWYTEGLKYSDMAYNFLVDRFGRLYEGRAGGMDRPVVGGHTAGLNRDSFAVSAMGNFDEYKPDDAKMDAIRESVAHLMAWKFGLSDRDPGGEDSLISEGTVGGLGYYAAGQTATLNRVSGHRDAGKTACPGQYLYEQVPAIRDRAAAIFSEDGAPAVPTVPDLLEPDPVTDEFNFRGSGYGDGVGLPKAGVVGQARNGRKSGGILRHYLSGVSVEGTDDTRTLWVSLSNPGRLRIDSTALRRGGGAVRVAGGGKAVRGDASSRIRARISDSRISVETRERGRWKAALSGKKVNVRWAGTRSAGKLGTRATAVRLGKDTLRAGAVSLYARDGRIRVIAKLRVGDEYLPYLETVPRTWPDQAQRTMAIVARSNALTLPWDPACMCHTTGAQFPGLAATSASGYRTWAAAVRRTSVSDGVGLAVKYDGGVIEVPVFDSTGGATLNAADVWGEDLPWARSAEDPWSLDRKNTQYATWARQSRSQEQVSALFGLEDIVRLDLRSRLAGGAVAQAVATDATGRTATISGEQLRTGLELPSAYIARAVNEDPESVSSLSASLTAARPGAPVVVRPSDPTVVALAAGYAAAGRRPLYVVGAGGPDPAARQALRRAKSVHVVGALPPSIEGVTRPGRIRRIEAGDVETLSLLLAGRSERDGRRSVFIADAGNHAATASAAMGAARAGGYVLSVVGAPSKAMRTWVGTHATRSVVVAPRKEITDAEAVGLRKAVRVGGKNAVARSARVAGLGPRRGTAMLVGSDKLVAAATAAATRRPVLLVAPGTANRRVLRFLQASPAISDLESVGADAEVVARARRA